MTQEKNNPQADSPLTLVELLARLDAEGQEVVVIALGEGLRIGRAWLGGEFLLMGLSKQRGRPFYELLREMGIEAGEWRGWLRGMVGIATRQTWQRVNVRKLGAKAWKLLPEASLGSAGHDGQRLIVTPRTLTVLRAAHEMAGEKEIGHRELLEALLQQRGCPPVTLFFEKAQEKGWSEENILPWLEAYSPPAVPELVEGHPLAPSPTPPLAPDPPLPTLLDPPI